MRGPVSAQNTLDNDDTLIFTFYCFEEDFALRTDKRFVSIADILKTVENVVRNVVKTERKPTDPEDPVRIYVSVQEPEDLHNHVYKPKTVNISQIADLISFKLKFAYMRRLESDHFEPGPQWSKTLHDGFYTSGLPSQEIFEKRWEDTFQDFAEYVLTKGCLLLTVHYRYTEDIWQTEHHLRLVLVNKEAMKRERDGIKQAMDESPAVPSFNIRSCKKCLYIRHAIDAESVTCA